MNRSIIIAASLLFVILAYFGIRSAMRDSASEDVSEQSIAEVSSSAKQPDVIVKTVSMEPHAVRLKINGRTAPDRVVTVKAGTTGTVVSTPAIEGSYVKRGAVLCGLDVEARRARVQEAEALLASANVEFNAARTLAEKGLSPENRVTAAQAQVDAATAALNAARIELSKTNITAPFSGIFETRLAEAGDFLTPGAPCGLLVDLSPLIFSSEVSEDYAGQLESDQTGLVHIANGETFPARIRYVSQSASDTTRTFLIEAEIDTANNNIPAGISAEFEISVGEVPATLVSPALLTLADTGELGMRYVTTDNRVAFAAVEVIDEALNGAWVTGLPAGARIISVGQEYLSEGMTVRPVERTGGQP